MDTIKILVEKLNNGSYQATSRDEFGDVTKVTCKDRASAVKVCIKRTGEILNTKLYKYVEQDIQDNKDYDKE